MLNHVNLRYRTVTRKLRVEGVAQGTVGDPMALHPARAAMESPAPIPQAAEGSSGPIATLSPPPLHLSEVS